MNILRNILCYRFILKILILNRTHLLEAFSLIFEI